MKLHVPLGQVLLSSSDTSAEQRFRLHSRTSGGQSLEWVVVTRSIEDWWDVLLPMAIHHIEGTDGFNVSSEIHWQSGVKTKRDSNPAWTVRSPVQANALTHSATAPPKIYNHRVSSYTLNTSLLYTRCLCTVNVTFQGIYVLSLT